MPLPACHQPELSPRSHVCEREVFGCSFITILARSIYLSRCYELSTRIAECDKIHHTCFNSKSEEVTRLAAFLRIPGETHRSAGEGDNHDGSPEPAYGDAVLALV